MAVSSSRDISLFCVGNGGFVWKKGILSTDKHTTRFLIELNEKLSALVFCQSLSLIKAGADHSVNDFNLGLDKSIHALALPIDRTSWARKVWSYFSFLPKLFVEIYKIDFLYLFVPGNLPIICATFAILLNKPYGIYLRGEHGMGSRLYGLILKKSRFVLGTGEAVCVHARRYCKDVAIVTPMIDISLKDLKFRQSQKKVGPWQLLFVGRVENRKGICDLINAATLLHESSLPFELKIVGGAGNDGDLEYFETTLPVGLKDKVKFIGMVSDRNLLFRYYQQSDLFVFPSHDEGFPRVLYEAMSFGVPIITTFVGGIPFVMKDEVNCMRINVGDPIDLSSKVLKLLRDIDLRNKLSVEASETIKGLTCKWKKSHAMQVVEKIGVLT